MRVGLAGVVVLSIGCAAGPRGPANATGPTGTSGGSLDDAFGASTPKSPSANEPVTIAEDPCAGGQVTPDSTGEGVGVGKGEPKDGNIKDPGMGAPGPVSGAMDPEVVRRVIKKHVSAIQYCYESALVADPALAGKVTVRFTVAPDGTVSSAAATGMAATVTDCIEKAFKTFVFPKSTSPTTITYPFTFAPT